MRPARRRPSRNFIICAAVILALLLCVAGYYGYNAIRKHQNLNYFYKMIDEVDSFVPDNISEAFGEYELVNSIRAESNSTVKWNDNHDWYDWTENIDVYIYVEDEFDSWSERNKYDYIHSVGGTAMNDVQKLIEDNFPRYKEYRDFLHVEDLCGRDLYFIRSDHIYIKTSVNTYRYANSVKYYYIENDHDVYVRDASGNWLGASSSSSGNSSSNNSSSSSSSGSSSKRSSGSSGKSSSDPYNAKSYDDPEAFYEDNFYDFDGYDDAELYWEDEQ